jgi:tetratricopeptide (TPR) repeat protein
MSDFFDLLLQLLRDSFWQGIGALAALAALVPLIWSGFRNWQRRRGLSSGESASDDKNPSSSSSGNISTGNIDGKGVAVGHRAQATHQEGSITTQGSSSGPQAAGVVGTVIQNSTIKLSLALSAIVIAIGLVLSFGLTGIVDTIERMTPTATPAPTPLAGPTATPDETLIIVGSFDDRSGTNDGNVEVMRRTHNELLRLARENNIPGVRIMLLDESIIKSDEQARALGRQYGARLVIWGWRDDTSAIIKGTRTDEEQPTPTSPEQEIGRGGQLNKTTVPVCLGYEAPAQGTYIAFFTLGQSLIDWTDRQKVELARDFIDTGLQGIELRPVDMQCSSFNPWNGYALRGHLNGTIALFLANEGKPTEAIEWREYAIESYEEAIRLKRDELKRDEAWVYSSKGYSEARLADLLAQHDAEASLSMYRQAIASYDRAIELDPDFAGAYSNRGNAYGALGEHERAIEDYDRAIEIDPDFAGAYVGRGIAYRNLEQYEQAIASYDRAIEIDPEYALAYNNRGNAYGALGEHERAIEDYDRAIEIDPDFAGTHRGRGHAYGALGEYEQAIASYDRAIEIDPEDAGAHIARGHAYFENGEYERAIEDYDRAIEFGTEIVFVYYARGNAHKHAGNTQAAIADFERYLELSDDSYWREQAEQHLAELRGE